MVEAGAEYFTPEPEALLNDAFLGLSAVAFGLVIWGVILLVKDPLNMVRKTIIKQR